MENKFFLQNNIEKLEKGKHSFFLDPKEQQMVSSILHKKKIPYQIYKPYEQAEKVLFYGGDKPSMEVLELISSTPLEHRAILGTLFHHQILPYFYSDLMLEENHCYLVCLQSVATYMKENIHEIGKSTVTIKSRPLTTLNHYQPKFETIILHVTSLRLDGILSKLLKESRKKVDDIFSKKEVIYNYEVASKKEILLKPGDVFSVRGYGKFIFRDLIYQNKKGNMDIEILKYQ